MEDGCFACFDDIASYENHYEEFHRHKCSICGRVFVNSYCHHLHLEESHSAIFKLLRQRFPMKPLYKCFEESCPEIFVLDVERDRHVLEVHNIRESVVVDVKRKKVKRQQICNQRGLNDIEIAYQKVGAREKIINGKKKLIPRSIIFGCDEHEPMFENVRRLSSLSLRTTSEN